MILLTIILFIVAILAYKFLLSCQWSETWIIGSISLAVCLIINISTYFIGTRQDYYSEIWNFKGTAVTYYEPWDETVPCRHPKYKTVTVTRRDSKGKSYRTTERVQDGYYHLYDVDYHTAYYTVTTEYKQSIGIDKSTYEYWSNLWHNVQFVDMHRHYHSIDGDAYTATFTGAFDQICPIENVQDYKNPIRVSNSVFNYREVDQKTKDKYYRPADKQDLGGIVSYDNVVFTTDEAMLMRRVNATLGPSSKIHIIILLFDAKRNSSTEMNTVLAAWKGPNKNELIIAIGVDDSRNISWSQCYSWCDDTTIHAKVRQDILELKTLDFTKIKDILLKEVPQYWHRKSFKDFNYIQNPLPATCYIVVFILNVGVYIGVGVYLSHCKMHVGKNGFDHSW